MENIDEVRTTWIFQANPKYYDIQESLTTESKELWNCIQHAKKIAAGDRVLIWISGDDAGIYAIGKILTEPVLRPDSSIGMSYWTNAEKGAKPRPRVWVEYEKVFHDNPLYKRFLQWDSELGGLSIIANPRGTNFKVTQEQWLAIQEWLSDVI